MANLFEDLIPKDVPKAPKQVSPTQNAFADLIPKPLGEQVPNIAHKGDMAPGSRAIPDPYLGRAEGVLLNFGTEVGGVVQGLVDMARNGKIPAEAMAIPQIAALVGLAGGEGRLDPGLGEATQQRKAALDAQLAAAHEYRPYETATQEVVGNIQSAGVPAAKALEGAGLLSKVIRGGAAGGVIGGISGAGEGEGLEDRANKGSAGAATGTVAGGLIPVGAKAVGQGIRLLKAVGRATTAPVRALADAETFASGKVAEALQRDKIAPDRAAKLLRLKSQVKPDTVLADVGGENTQNLLRASANVPSEARGKLVRDLFVRQERQLDRLRADVGQAFGDPKQFTGTVENLTLSRKQAAKPLFDAAFQTGTPWTVQLQSVLSRPLTRKLVGRAEEAAANRGEQFKALFAKVGDDGKVTFERVPDTEALHRVKMEIDAAIRTLKQGKETGLGNVQLRDLTILKRDLVDAIQNPIYKRALKQYAGDSAALNAIDDGFENGVKMEPEAIAKTLQGLSKSEADLWRMGLARRVVNELRDAGRSGTNRAEILNSPRYLDRLRAAFKDNPTAKDFLRKLQMERKMVQTRDAVRGNSTTARQLAEGMEAGVEAEGVRQNLDLGMKLASGNFTGALLNWISRAKNMATGLRPEVADQVIKMLISKDPATVQRAQALVQREIAKLTRRQGTAGRVERGVNFGGFSAIPSLASPSGPTARQ